MPIWLRNYTFEEIKKYYDTINKEGENDIATETSKQITVPEHLQKPTYFTKKSTKI